MRCSWCRRPLNPLAHGCVAADGGRYHATCYRESLGPRRPPSSAYEALEVTAPAPDVDQESLLA